VPDEVKLRLEQEENLEVLKGWFKNALRMKDVGTFEEYLRSLDNQE